MADVFISYARSTARQAQAAAAALRAIGYSVWIDDDLPAHRAYSKVIEEQLVEAKAALVFWSRDAADSEWVMSEAARAREDHKLVQVRVEMIRLPMPFDQIQCADLRDWEGEVDNAGWRKVVGSIGELIGGRAVERPNQAAPKPPILALPDKPSIAVLPFTDLSGGKDEDCFCECMVEEIVTALTRFPSLFVIASGSTLGYRDAARNLKQIGAELGVRFILEGSVRRASDRVRIAVKLVDAALGEQIWAERFDGLLEDVFALQDTVANAVASQIEPTIEAAEIRRANARQTSDLDAYGLFLRALHLVKQIDGTANLEAIEILGHALARDPAYGSALALLSYCHAVAVNFGWTDHPDEARRTALELVNRALLAGHDEPVTLMWCSQVISILTGDIDAADALIERALARNPGAARLWWASAWIKMMEGRLPLALEHAMTCLRLDPRSVDRPITLACLGWTYFRMNRFEEALAAFQESYKLRPHNPGARMAIITCLGHLGRLTEARAALQGFDSGRIPALSFPNQPDFNQLIHAGLTLARADV